MLNSLRRLAIVVYLVSTLGRASGGDYLSNLGNRWIDPDNPTARDIGIGSTLFPGATPFVVQFFTGARSVETSPAIAIATNATAIGTNSIGVAAFELNSVTYEFFGGHLQPWSDLNVQIYREVGNQEVLVGELGNPVVNPALTQWPESVNPPWFCTTYIDYVPLSEIQLQPSSEYSVALSVPRGSLPSFGLLFTILSNYVTSTDWRMGATITHSPMDGYGFLKIAIGASAILGTNSPPVAISNVFLSATKVGTNLLLSWPATAAQYHLYALPSLQQAAWEPVSAEAIITNGNFAVTLALSGVSSYFRLQSQ